MDELRNLLFEKGRVGKVLECLKRDGLPDPSNDPDRALLYGHAICLFGDYQQAQNIYTAVLIDVNNNAERLWGLGNASLRLGDLKESGPMLEQALQNNPPTWLGPQIFIALTYYHISKGNFEDAKKAINDGIDAAVAGHSVVDQLTLEGYRGVINICQGAFEEAASRFENVIKHLLVRDSVLAAAHFLINMSSAYQALGDSDRASNCLDKAEELIQKSGSRGRLIFLRQVQGNLWRWHDSLLNKAEWAFKEALELMKELPIPKLEIQVTCNLAQTYFAKGDLGSALHLVEKALDKARGMGLSVLYDLCLLNLGVFNVQSGRTRPGIDVLLQARDISESLKRLDFCFYEALYLAKGYADLGQRDKALDWFKKCLELAKHHHISSASAEETNILTDLLLKLCEELPSSEFLSWLIIQVHSQALLKRFLHHGPDGKISFLRALKVHDARHFRSELKKLKNDQDKEVRQTSRLILRGWQQHVGYRVYALGTFRVFLEGKMLSHKDWITPGVQRLFLFFITHPGEWHTTEYLLETLWTEPHPKKTMKVLNNLFSYLRTVFEPWHLQGMEYAFFQSRRGAYGFFPGERFWIDSQTFLEATKRAERSYVSRDLREARKAFREALDLYRGDYLKEYPYEEWLDHTRDYLTGVYFRSVLRYATIERESGNSSECRRVLEDALFKDLSRSGCVALLIQVLAEMRLSQEAKEWGQRHIAFMTKLKEDPAPEVTEALGRLQRHFPKGKTKNPTRF